MPAAPKSKRDALPRHGRPGGVGREVRDHAHDEPSADDDHGHHAPTLEEMHESPLTMLVPLGLLATGAVFAGMVFFHYFVGEGAAEFWRASLFVAKPAEGELPVWVELAPLTVTCVSPRAIAR